MHRLNLVTCLRITGAVALAYVAVLFRDGWQLPHQLNSLILTTLGVGLVVAGILAPAGRALVRLTSTARKALDAALQSIKDDLDEREGRVLAEVAKVAARLGAVHGDLSERLAELEATQPIPAIAGGPTVYRSAVAGAAGAQPDWQVNDDEIRGFLARELMDPPEDDPPPGGQ